MLLAVGAAAVVENLMGNFIVSPSKVKNPESILVLVNKEHSLEKNYVPEDLIEPDVRFSPGISDRNKQMRKEAAEALEKLFKKADKENIYLYCVSGYRSYNDQKRIYDRKVKTAGRKEADKYVAYPGQSEHQTGLAMDITNKNGVNNSLVEDFGSTKEGKWLKANAYKYGFIIRYPRGKEAITGYSYEPWHIRYVGTSTAQKIKNNNIVLEEYLDKDTQIALSSIF